MGLDLRQHRIDFVGQFLSDLQSSESFRHLGNGVRNLYEFARHSVCHFLSLFPVKHCGGCNRSLPLDAFHANRFAKDGRQTQCKECHGKRYDRERWHKTNVFRNFGITKEEYEAMAEAQNHCCAICGTPETAKRGRTTLKLAVDHNHKTGKVRGLLCGTCNRKLGVLENESFVAAATEYLSKFGGVG